MAVGSMRCCGRQGRDADCQRRSIVLAARPRQMSLVSSHVENGFNWTSPLPKFKAIAWSLSEGDALPPQVFGGANGSMRSHGTVPEERQAPPAPAKVSLRRFQY